MKQSHPHHLYIFVVGALLALASCTPRPVLQRPGTTTAPPTPGDSGPAASAPAAPWSAAPLRPASIAAAYLDSWNRADNRGRCALLAPDPSSTAILSTAVSRTATFSGGWGVAYDLPDVRSAFGVAGTGSSAWSPDLYSSWPRRMAWADGSEAGYGPEAGAEPNWLAYLTIPGQECLYNVWSRRGPAHLEQLLVSLRRVATR